MRHHRGWIGAVTVVVLALPFVTAASGESDGPRWFADLLPTPDDYACSWANDVNARGDAVGGLGDEKGNSLAASWWRRVGRAYEVVHLDDYCRRPPDYEGWFSGAVTLANDGVACGSVYNPGTGEQHACLWDTKRREFVALHLDAGWIASVGWEVNESGEASGFVVLPDDGTLGYAYRPVVWRAGGAVADELPCPKGWWGEAFGISDDGCVAGSVFVLDEKGNVAKSHAALWTWDGARGGWVLTDLHAAIVAADADAARSMAWDVSGSGEVVGHFVDGDGMPVPYRWTAGSGVEVLEGAIAYRNRARCIAGTGWTGPVVYRKGVLHEIALPDGYGGGDGSGVNAAGTVAGYSLSPKGFWRAWLAERRD